MIPERLLPSRVIGVVGPSGVGKDSVMAALARAEPRLRTVRRVITRPLAPGAEDHDPVDDAEFARRLAAGGFCLHWSAHGLHYGIPRAVLDPGREHCALVNLSRSVLVEADAVFPDFIVLSLTARPETLAARLAGRGRETHSEIAARLARQGTPLPCGLCVVEIANDGPLDETVARALAALRALAV